MYTKQATEELVYTSSRSGSAGAGEFIPIIGDNNDARVATTIITPYENRHTAII